MKLNFITSVKKYISGQALFSNVKHVASNVVKFAEKTIQQTQTYKTLSRLFLPRSSFTIYGNPLGIFRPMPYTVWNSQIKNIVNPRAITRIFSHTFKQAPQIETLVITDTTFGVPPEYLTPTTLAGKQYVNNLDELFRFFIIYDVGLIQMPTGVNAKQFWQFVFESAWFNRVNGYSYMDVVSTLLGSDTKVTPPIKFALNTNEFTFGFTNQFQDTFLQQFNNIVSNTARQIAYVGGWENVKSVIGPTVQELLKHFGPIGAFITSAGTATIQSIQKLLNKSQLLRELAQGKQIVFPKIWTGSSFTNSYNVRFTLYSLSRDENEIRKRILLPLALLLALATPIAPDDPYFYQYPFVFQGEIEGVRKFNAAVITDLRLSFGGERSIFDVDKTYLAIDVELSIQDVYDVMVTPVMQQSISLVPTTTQWFSYLQKFLSKGR